jgi:hypothetical protein
MRINRRDLLKLFGIVVGMIYSPIKGWGSRIPFKKATVDQKDKIYRAVGGTPDENLKKVIEITGGIEKIIGQDDVVVLKPNVQWWNHGVPNLSVIRQLVDLIMNRT